MTTPVKKKPAPDGIDKLHQLLERIERLEAGAHAEMHSHTLAPEAIEQIAEIAIQRIVARLSPPPVPTSPSPEPPLA